MTGTKRTQLLRNSTSAGWLRLLTLAGVFSLLAGLLGTAGCSESPSESSRFQSTTSQENSNLSNSAASGEAASAAAHKKADFLKKKVTVSVHQGTNMAVAVNPTDHTQRVLSLQGQLFLVQGDGSYWPLTNAYFDAREPQFAPDGSRVVFHGYANGNWDIWEVPVGSDAASQGRPQPLTDDPFDDREPVYTQEGDTVYFSSDRGGSYDIWRLRLGDEEQGAQALVQVTNTQGNAYSPSISSAGLVYAERGPASSKLVLLEGSDSRVIAEERGLINGVQFSPDASFVSYQVLQGDATALKTVEVANSKVQVVSAPGDDVFPFRANWLSKGELAYSVNGEVVRQALADDAAQAQQIWPFQINLELTRHQYQRRQRDYSSEPVRALGLTNPVISNDGSHIYFTALGDIWAWQPATQDLQNLTDDAAADIAPALSPDSQQLAFVSDRDGQIGLYLMDLGSGEGNGEVTQLPIQAGQISGPSWSPDGKQLSVFVDVPGNPLGGQLTVLDLATDKATPVLEPMPPQVSSFSPDGKHVAVTRLNPYSSRYREGMYELVIAPIDGGAATVVAPSAHESILSAVLTSDGAMTYVQGARLHRLELDEKFNVLESAGQVTQETTDMPSWSANGDHLVYLSGNRLMRMDFTTGGLHDVTPPLTYTRAAPGEQYVVRAGRVFVGDENNSYLADQDIWINGDRIEKITPVDAALEGVEIVDASDKTVVPGLFEMHAHMGETSEVQGRVWLAYGVTTVRDPGSNPYIAKERQEAWDSGRRVGPRTHITGYLTDGNRVFYSMAEGIVSQQHLDDALMRTQDLELDFVKTYVRLPDGLQAQVVNFAHALGIPVSSHELYPAVAHGMDHVEHIGGTSRRGYQPKVSLLGHSYQDVIALLRDSGMGITATAVLPGFSVIVQEEPDWFETPQFDHFYGPALKQGYQMMVARFGSAAASTAQANGEFLKALTDANALLVTGTDSPFVPYGAGLHAEFRLYARAGIANADILRQATIRSAQAAGVDAELGSIEAGKLADLVVVDGDPLNDIRDLDQVVMTIKNGYKYSLANLLETADIAGKLPVVEHVHAHH